MTRSVCVLLTAMLCLSLAAAPGAQAASDLSAAVEGVGPETVGGSISEEFEQKGADPQPAAIPITAQQWIRAFLVAADDQGLSLDADISYDSGISTGQDSYSIIIADTPVYSIGVSVFSDDGARVTMCSMRLTSVLLRSGELVQASDTLWRAARAMITISVPKATAEEIETLCETLCPDLPAALLREQQVDSVYELHNVTHSLWTGMLSEAYFDGVDTWVNGYIVDFVLQSDAPIEAG